MMPVSAEGQSGLWDAVLELTRSLQEKNGDPTIWAIQVRNALTSAAAPLPSIDLAHLLVSHICWGNHVPITWKFLDKALMHNLVPPILLLALLSARVIPNRLVYPTSYRLYMELLRRHSFSFSTLVNAPDYNKIMKSIDDVLNLSQIFGPQACEPGTLLVEFVFSVVWQLLDASLDDENLLDLTPEKKSRWPSKPQDMEIDGQDSFSMKDVEQQEMLKKVNTAMAIEMIVEFLENTVTARILFLTRWNMPSHWRGFLQRLQLLAANSLALKTLENVTPESLLQLTSERSRVLKRESKTISQQEFHAILASGSLISSAGQCHGASRSSLWLPIDLFLEGAIEHPHVRVISAVETLTGLAKAIQAVNVTTWNDTFLGLWISALRLVQRERDPNDNPLPRLDTCLCMLLSITTLAVANIIEEEESIPSEEAEWKENQAIGNRRKDLISSLQQLGNFEGLLTAPQAVTSIANQAAAKANMYVSGLIPGNEYIESMSMNDMPMDYCGNMRHLIVEACISRNLLDTSAYLWPGYVNTRGIDQMPQNVPSQVLGWSSLMKDAPLTPSLINVLVSIPATSLTEIEKVYEIAVSGSDDDKISAATILCGASLLRGWNVQEQIVLFITRLLSPPVPLNHSNSESHLIKYAPFLNVLFVGIASVEIVQIFSLHGLAPQLACALIPLCEVFGSIVPDASWTSISGEELTSHVVFSNAFTLLLRLWRFNHTPSMEKAPPVGTHLSLELLLMVRNSQLAGSANSPMEDPVKSRRLLRKLAPTSVEPMFMDSFPKFKGWYKQHHKCIASTLSGLVHGTFVHQIVDTLISMMFRKIGRAEPLNSGSSNSSDSTVAEEISVKLKIPAWDILEAIPFVLDSALTACAHGKLSPRELATGLKDLADFLPATLGTIVSYYSAEVRRGIWKPANMNGIDWPNPAANLSKVEQYIKKILTAIGVDVPSLSSGSSPATLPLPLAALLSLTITYKLGRAPPRFLTVIGPALNDIGTSCPWPCMAIMAALWAQKVKRWSDILMFRATQTVFHHSNDAVFQLLKSCFTSTLGLTSSEISTNGGVRALLGHGFKSQLSWGITPVSPGSLYLRVHRFVREVKFVSEVIVSLLMSSVRQIAATGLPKDAMEKMRKAKYSTRYGQVSLAAAMTRVKVAASLGASLVWIIGRVNLVQSLLKETLPSWFISTQTPDAGTEPGGMVAMLSGYALAYFALLSGMFAWGIDSTSHNSRRRPKVLRYHLDFLAKALNGKILIGCDWSLWRAYVSGFVGLMVSYAPRWVVEVDVDVLERLGNGLRKCNEEELAVALLGLGGINSMGKAAELIIKIGS